MRKDLLLTAMVQFVVLISLLLSFKLVSYYFGEGSFVEYTVAKRNIAFAVVIIGLGLNISLTRYVSENLSVSEKSLNYLASSVLIFMFSSVLAGIFMTVFTEELSSVLYADLTHQGLVKSSYVAILGLLSQTLVYSYYRGRMYVKRANMVGLIGLAIFPIIAILIGNNVIQVFFLTGFFQFLFSFVIILCEIRRKNHVFVLKSLVYRGRELLKYGAVRIPSEVGLVGIFMLLVIFANHKYGLKEGGYLSFSITVVTTISYVFSPIGILLLPRLSWMGSKRLYNEMRNLIVKAIFFVLLGSVLFVLGFILIKNELLVYLIPEIDCGSVDFIGYTVFSLFLYPVFSVSKNIIDACYKKGENSKNLLYSVVLFLPVMLVIALGGGYNELSVFVSALGAFFTVLFCFSMLSIYRFLGNKR